MLIKVPKILYDRGVVKNLALRTGQSEANVRRILRFEDRSGAKVEKTLELAVNVYKCKPTYFDVHIRETPETEATE